VTGFRNPFDFESQSFFTMKTFDSSGGQIDQGTTFITGVDQPAPFGTKSIEFFDSEDTSLASGIV